MAVTSNLEICIAVLTLFLIIESYTYPKSINQNRGWGCQSAVSPDCYTFLQFRLREFVRKAFLGTLIPVAHRPAASISVLYSSKSILRWAI